MAINDARPDLLSSRCVGDTVDVFIGMKKAEQMSPRTIRYYQDNLRPLRVFMGEDAPVSALSTDALNRYMTYSVAIKASRGQPGAVAHRRRFDCLRTFINWLVWMGYIPASPLRAKAPKVPRRVISPFTTEEVQKMLDACKGRGTANRDNAIILTLTESAIRLDELAGILVDDIDWKEGWVLVHGKGNTDRRAPLARTTLRSIYRYYVTRRKDAPQLWLSEEGKPLTRSGVQQVVRRLSKKALGKVYGPHKFRHTAACYQLERGMSAEDLMRFLGHKSIKQALEYAEYVHARHALSEARKFSMVEREGLK